MRVVDISQVGHAKFVNITIYYDKYEIIVTTVMLLIGAHMVSLLASTSLIRKNPGAT